jgi:hypothetical protein
MGGRVHPGCPDDSDDGETQRPGAEAHDGALAVLADFEARGMEAVQADRHPWAALVWTIDSLASRHGTVGTTCRARAQRPMCDGNQSTSHQPPATSHQPPVTSHQ